MILKNEKISVYMSKFKLIALTIMSLLLVAMGVGVLASGDAGMGLFCIVLFGVTAVVPLIYLFHSKQPLVVLTKDYIRVRVPMKNTEFQLSAADVAQIGMSRTKKNARLNLLTSKEVPADFKKFVKTQADKHLISIPLNYVDSHVVLILNDAVQEWQESLVKARAEEISTDAQVQEQTEKETSPLVALNTAANSVGASGSFVKKGKFVREAMQFPVTPEESKLLGKHIAKTYGIVMAEILASLFLAGFELIFYDFGILMLKLAFSLHGITYLIFLGLFMWLAQKARKTHQKGYEIGAIALTIWMLTQSVLVGIGALYATVGFSRAMIVTAEAFLITFAIFSSCALFGLQTKKNVASWGGPLLGALFAVIILMLFNILIGSTLLMNLLLAADIVVFVLYTIYDNQMIKVRFLANFRGEVADGYDGTFLALDSSLDIFLDFINLFLDILSIFSSSNSN